MNYIVTPGRILKEYLITRGITQKQLALHIGMSETFVSKLINNKARISAEVAIKLEDVFEDVQAEFWLDLEKHYQLRTIRNKNLVIISKWED